MGDYGYVSYILSYHLSAPLWFLTANEQIDALLIPELHFTADFIDNFVHNNHTPVKYETGAWNSFICIVAQGGCFCNRFNDDLQNGEEKTKTGLKFEKKKQTAAGLEKG